MPDTRYEPTELMRFCESILTTAGLPRDDASRVADSLVEAELRGIASHGLLLLLVWMKKFRAGEAKPRPCMVETPLSESVDVLDADRALGPVSACHAINRAMELSENHVAGMVLTRNAGGLGYAGHYPLMAARRGYIGLTMSNSIGLVAPWGGRLPLLGTNPVAVAIPAASEERPYVFDMACSVVAWLNLVDAAREGKEIPLGWALDRQGEPTISPAEALQGAMLPFGQYKGYGLALTIELLTGILSGAPLVEPIPRAPGAVRPAGVSHLMVALKVSAFMPLDEFRSRSETLLAQIRRCPPANGAAGVRVPGDESWRRRDFHLAHGVPLQTRLLDELQCLAEEMGVPFLRERL